MVVDLGKVVFKIASGFLNMYLNQLSVISSIPQVWIYLHTHVFRKGLASWPKLQKKFIMFHPIIEFQVFSFSVWLLVS